MDLRHQRYDELPLAKTKIIATVGPASCHPNIIQDLIHAGVDVFRLNFAHGTHDRLSEVVATIRDVSTELNQPIAVLGDLSGPKIRLGELPENGLQCNVDQEIAFVRNAAENQVINQGDGEPVQLSCSYERLLDDLKVGDRVLIADGIVVMHVKSKDQEKAICVVEHGGRIRSRQGINLPGVQLSTPSLTRKDRDDLRWALQHNLDFVGLSFVRSADDVRLLRREISEQSVDSPCRIIAKIEKAEAIADLDRILVEADAVMVARGDLGVEVDITHIPALQKRIIRACNKRRIPVITATQMLESMINNEMPTRAEATDIANAVLDGSDAVMLSGETAVGHDPVRAVEMMSRIAQEAERLVVPKKTIDPLSKGRRATLMTEAITHGASTTAEHLQADLMIVATHTGRTALAISKQRSQVPVVALTNEPVTARQMCLCWGVTPIETDVVFGTPENMLEFVVEWGRKENVIRSGSRMVLLGTTDWSRQGKNLMIVHIEP